MVHLELVLKSESQSPIITTVHNIQREGTVQLGRHDVETILFPSGGFEDLEPEKRESSSVEGIVMHLHSVGFQ
jgi:hypothetical protein